MTDILVLDLTPEMALIVDNQLLACHAGEYQQLAIVKIWVNVKSRLIKLVLLPLWYGNKDIIRDTLS